MWTLIGVGVACVAVGLWVGARLGARVATARAATYMDDVRNVLADDDRDPLVLLDAARRTVDNAHKGIVTGTR